MSNSIPRQVPEDLFQAYLTALLAGDARNCRALVEKLFAAETPVKVVYEQLFTASMYQVGALWEAGKISVATEHLATATTDALMSLAYPYLFEAPHSGKAAVVSCVASEYHQIGGKMVADTFEMHGWHGYFLGANTPVKDLLSLIDEKKPNVVALSLTLYFGMASLLETMRVLRSEFSALPIWVGGQAFRWGGADQVLKIPNVKVLTSLSDLEQNLLTWESDHA